MMKDENRCRLRGRGSQMESHSFYGSDEESEPDARANISRSSSTSELSDGDMHEEPAAPPRAARQPSPAPSSASSLSSASSHHSDDARSAGRSRSSSAPTAPSRAGDDARSSSSSLSSDVEEAPARPRSSSTSSGESFLESDDEVAAARDIAATLDESAENAVLAILDAAAVIVNEAEALAAGMRTRAHYSEKPGAAPQHGNFAPPGTVSSASELAARIAADPRIKEILGEGGANARRAAATVKNVAKDVIKFVGPIGTQAVTELISVLVPLLLKTMVRTVLFGTPDEINTALDAPVLGKHTLGEVFETVFAHEFARRLLAPGHVRIGYGDGPDAPGVMSAMSRAISGDIADRLAARRSALAASSDNDEWDDAPADAPPPAPELIIDTRRGAPPAPPPPALPPSVLRAGGRAITKLAQPLAPEVRQLMPEHTLPVADAIARAAAETQMVEVAAEAARAEAASADLRSRELEAAAAAKEAELARLRDAAAAKEARRRQNNREFAQAVGTTAVRALESERTQQAVDALAAGSTAAMTTAMQHAVAQSPNMFAQIGGLFQRKPAAPRASNEAALASAASSLDKASGTLHGVLEGAGSALNTAGPLVTQAVSIVAGVAQIVAKSVAGLFASILANPDTQKALAGVANVAAGAVGEVAKTSIEGVGKGVGVAVKQAFEGDPDGRALPAHFQLPRRPRAPRTWHKALSLAPNAGRTARMLQMRDGGRVYSPFVDGFGLGRVHRAPGRPSLDVDMYLRVNHYPAPEEMQQRAAAAWRAIMSDIRRRRLDRKVPEYVEYLEHAPPAQQSRARLVVPPGLPGNVLSLPTDTAAWTAEELVLAADYVRGLAAGLAQ